MVYAKKLIVLTGAGGTGAVTLEKSAAGLNGRLNTYELPDAVRGVYVLAFLGNRDRIIDLGESGRVTVKFSLDSETDITTLHCAVARVDGDKVDIMLYGTLAPRKMWSGDVADAVKRKRVVKQVAAQALYSTRRIEDYFFDILPASGGFHDGAVANVNYYAPDFRPEALEAAAPVPPGRTVETDVQTGPPQGVLACEPDAEGPKVPVEKASSGNQAGPAIPDAPHVRTEGGAPKDPGFSANAPGEAAPPQPAHGPWVGPQLASETVWQQTAGPASETEAAAPRPNRPPDLPVEDRAQEAPPSAPDAPAFTQAQPGETERGAAPADADACRAQTQGADAPSAPQAQTASVGVEDTTQGQTPVGERAQAPEPPIVPAAASVAQETPVRSLRSDPLALERDYLLKLAESAAMTAARRETAATASVPHPQSDSFRLSGAPKPKPLSFYELIKDKLDRLFASGSPCAELENIMPDTKWVKIDYDGRRFYAVGLIGARPDYVCYGVPARFTPTAPEELAGYCNWVPLKADDPEGDGYWLLFQDADTGESIAPEA